MLRKQWSLEVGDGKLMWWVANGLLAAFCVSHILLWSADSQIMNWNSKSIYFKCVLAFLVCNFQFYFECLCSRVTFFFSLPPFVCFPSPFHFSPAFYQLINPPRSFKSSSSPLCQFVCSASPLCSCVIFPLRVFSFWFLVLFLVWFCFLDFICFVICLCFTFLYLQFQISF